MQGRTLAGLHNDKLASNYAAGIDNKVEPFLFCPIQPQ